MYKIGFDNDKYLRMQSEKIRERIGQFGGKLFDDYHASRVLPGFHPDSKINMLAQLKDEAEIVIVINAADIEKNKVRSDLGITYDLDVLRLIDAFRGYGLSEKTGVSGNEGIPPLFHSRISFQYSVHRKR